MGDDTMTAAEARGLLASHELTGNGRTLAARALRSVIALHEAAATKERHAAFYMRQAWAVGVDATRRADALALREALPDVWERLRDAPEPEWPGDATAHVPPHGAVVYRADRLPPRLAARVEGVEGVEGAALVVEYRDPDAPGAGPAEWDSRAAAKRAAGLGDATWCGVAEGTGVVVVHDGPAPPREGG